jgi:hypothetical protein
MNQLVADHLPGAIHVILDNLNTHKPKRDQWGAWRGATPRSR